MNTEPKPALCYEVFDRQIQNFCKMLNAMIDGWDDYSSQEMTFDLLSLCTKASRLCYMADQDLALQHADVSQQRREKNDAYRNTFSFLVTHTLTQFLRGIIDKVNQGMKVEGHKSPMIPPEMSFIFPQLGDLLKMDGMSSEQFLSLQDNVTVMENILKNKKLTKFPGMRHEERFWHIIRLYSMTSYLLLHFLRVSQITHQDITPEQAGRYTEMAIQKYISDADTKANIDLYLAQLKYDNDGKPLNEKQILAARRELKSIVPKNLLLPFLTYADDPKLLGANINSLEFTAVEFVQLVEAEAKYQLLTQQLYNLQYPEDATPSLPNEVFNTLVGGRLVDMQELKKSISKMVALVEKKNHWFCVWSVLKHLLLIKQDSTFASFAHQMMRPEWFGSIDERLHFTSDNLSDYSHYFAEYDYTDWNREMFLEKRALYNMRKWSPKLYDNFSQLCQKMFISIKGYQFLGEIK